MTGHSPEKLAQTVRAAHDVYVAAIVAFRKAPSREKRQRIDDANIRYSDLMQSLFDPDQPSKRPRGRPRKEADFREATS